MNAAIYAIAGCVGFFISYMGITFAFISGTFFGVAVGSLALAAHIWSIRYVMAKVEQGEGRQAAVVLALPMFIVWAIIMVFSLVIGFAHLLYDFVAKLF